jgi:hypothetical protein
MAMLDTLLGRLAVVGRNGRSKCQGPEGGMRITGRGGARLSASGCLGTDLASRTAYAPCLELPTS